MAKLTDTEYERMHYASLSSRIASVMVLLSTNEIISVTPAAEVMFGYSPRELIGHSVHDLVPDLNRDKHANYFTDFQQNPQNRGMGGSNMQIYGRHKSGSTFLCFVELHVEYIERQAVVTATIISVPK